MIYNLGQIATSESYSNSSNPYSKRGGNYNNNYGNNPAGNRNNNNDNANNNIGFRVTLISYQIIYFKEYIQHKYQILKKSIPS